MRDYETPPDLPTDEYGHLRDAPTDPYGNLDCCVGSGDDFYCYDYFLGALGGRTIFVIHSVINSETGSFIQDNDYIVVDSVDPKFKGLGDFEAACIHAVMEAVESGLDWCGENGIRHTNTGWNQDPYYIVRSAARALMLARSDDPIPWAACSKPGWNARFGGTKINKACNAIADQDLMLPVSRKPRRPKRQKLPDFIP